MIERIIGIAIRDNASGQIWSVMGGIHADLRAPGRPHVADGFVTSSGRFVERGEAVVIAKYAGRP